MTKYRTNRKILSENLGNPANLLVSLNEVKGRKSGREHFAFQERWADMLYHLKVDCFAITLMSSVRELRGDHSSIKMIRNHWPGHSHTFIFDRDGLAAQAAKYNLPFNWHGGHDKVILRDPGLTRLRSAGINSGYIQASVINSSHCVLVCASESHDDEMVLNIDEHIRYIRTALNITHQNILRNYYDLYTPTALSLSKIEKRIFQLISLGAVNSQIAELTGYSLGNIKYHIQQVRSRLKQLNENDKTITNMKRIIAILTNSGLI